MELYHEAVFHNAMSIWLVEDSKDIFQNAFKLAHWLWHGKRKWRTFWLLYAMSRKVGRKSRISATGSLASFEIQSKFRNSGRRITRKRFLVLFRVHGLGEKIKVSAPAQISRPHRTSFWARRLLSNSIDVIKMTLMPFLERRKITDFIRFIQWQLQL